MYEASPLSRTLEAYGPGNDWALASRRQQTGYLVNEASDQVRLWRVKANGTLASEQVNPSDQLFYQPGTLYKTLTTDEENHQVIEFEDMEGQEVQRNVQDGDGTWMVTCYVYDELDQLAYVITPKLFHNKVQGQSGAVTLSEADDKELLFAYHYDKRSRIIEKLVPGSDWTHMVYNQVDLPVLSQNARQRETGMWSFTKYDPHGRVVLSGEITITDKDRASLQLLADNETDQFETHHGQVYGYTNEAFPSVTVEQVHLVNYYDDYAWGIPTGEAPYGMGFFSFNGLTQQPAKGLLTGSKAKLLDGSGQMLLTIHYYDQKNRLIQTHQQNPFRGTGGNYPVTRTDLWLNFTGELIKTGVYHRYADGKQNYDVLTEYMYDQSGRIIWSNHLVKNPNEQDKQPFTLAEYVYDEVGRLKQKRLQPGRYRTIEGTAPTDEIIRNTAVSGTITDNYGKIILKSGMSVSGGSSYAADPKGIQYGSATALQIVDYDYNVRSWLTGINRDIVSKQVTLDPKENDLFSLQLNYHEEGGFYNGNIRKQQWLSYSAKDTPPRSYTYSYDHVNRLTGANYEGGKFPGENYSLLGMSYDKNGNILSLIRRGMTGGTTSTPSFGPTKDGINSVDHLRYNYKEGSNSNKLSFVSDAVTGNIDVGDFRDLISTGEDYDYYKDGSLRSDNNKGIKSIIYNSLGQVQTVEIIKPVNGTHNTYLIEYLYDAMGIKWQMKVYNSIDQRTHYTYYGQGIQFETDPVAGTTNALSHILHDEGRVIKDPQSGALAYEYHYQDHLGNLRVAFRQQTSVTSQATLSFEPQNAAQEEAAFERVTQNRAVGIAQEGRYAAGLQREAGPSKTVRLLEGETLKASVFGHFKQDKPKRTTWMPLPILGQEQGLVDGKVKSKLVLRSGIVLPLQLKRKHKHPKAFMELVVRDTSNRITYHERKELTGIAKEQWQELFLEYKAQGDEMAEVSLVNESNETVYFDNLTLSQEPPIIVQENHYDPWGLNLAGIEKLGNPDHKFQYNGMAEKNDNLGLNWYETSFRIYDPQLGRFIQTDPAADFFPSINPYNFAFNNPISLADPDGLSPIDPIKLLKRLINGFVGDKASVQARRSQRENKKQGVTRRPGGGGNNRSDDRASSKDKDKSDPIRVAYDQREPRGIKPEGPDEPKAGSIPVPPKPEPDPNEDINPSRRRSSVRSGKKPRTFDEEIFFQKNSDQFVSYQISREKVSKLAQLLISSPEVRVHVQGNVNSESGDIVYGNSNQALNQTINGTTLRSLMNARARAVTNLLIRLGVNPRQITFGSGSVIKSRGPRVTFTVR